MTKSLRSLLLLSLLLLAIPGGFALAAPPRTPDAQAARADIQKVLGFLPRFFDAMADSVLPGAWEEMKGLQLNPSTALPGRTKELIGLAVAAQVPCRYCILAHTEFAQLNGATQTQLAEAIALAGLERHASAYLYGSQIDEARFRAEVARMVQNAKAPSAGKSAVKVVDEQSALADIAATLGFVPEFLRKIPGPALPGAWRELKSLKLDPNTSIGAKDKALIGLAVASQVPSRYCVIAETEFAKLAGASEREIQEAIGMAAITRNMSTLLNGALTDENTFRADVQRLVNGAKAAAKKAAAMTAKR